MTNVPEIIIWYFQTEEGDEFHIPDYSEIFKRYCRYVCSNLNEGDEIKIDVKRLRKPYPRENHKNYLKRYFSDPDATVIFLDQSDI